MVTFFWYDYLIFIIVLSASALIGVYYGFFGSKQKTVNEYLLGGKKMSVFPVAVSLAVSHFSAITLMVVPAEIYKFGAFYLYMTIAQILLGFITVYIFLPVFFNLQITSVYEYLEKRFDAKTRSLASLFYVISEILGLAVCLYTPALSLSVVTHIHVHLITVIITAICIFYTTIGGLKTVVWTDFLQVGIIFLSLIIVLILGFIDSENVWNTVVTGGRLDIFDFSLDPTKRDTFWTFVIGSTIYWTNYVSLTQSGVQKYLTLPTLKDCNNAVKIFVVVMDVVIILCILLGFLIYAHYSNCDPLLSGKIEKHEQLVPYYIMEIAGNLPGVFSLTLVAYFCASLSTVSSSLNAISGVIYKDFVTKFVKNEITEKTAGYILRIIVVIAGILVLSIVFVIEHLGDIFPLLMSVRAVADGPLVALFTSGVLIPKIKAEEAFYAAILVFIFQASIAIVSKIYLFNKAIVAIAKPLSVDGCANSSLISFNNTLTTGNKPFFIFRLSYNYQCVFGTILTIIVALIINYFTHRENRAVDKMLVSPVIHRFLPKPAKAERGQELDELMTNHRKQ
nr:PREDICTED: sodium-coupled monocarboxylate transporter 1-like isoform X2 [Tribolium castaneum]|eukprot:XP_015839654.1 PREDICTED: sodium-coupled monocarboxylate transporter 1-like isoform X2 [Tribolium castaneum]